MRTILVVCKYNRSISKMAAAYLASLLSAQEFQVYDAGVSVRKGERICQGAVEALGAAGITTESTGCNLLGLKEIKQADLILCSTTELVKKLTESYHSARGKSLHLMTYAFEKKDVFEPQKDVKSHTQCLQMMKPGLDAIIEKLKQE